MKAGTLKIISDAMASAKIPYEFGRFNSAIPTQYWVGEYQETESTTEDGLEESTFILTGTCFGTFAELEDAKQKIKKLFPSIGGRVAIENDGSSVAIFYGNSLMIPSMDNDIKRMQINLNVKEWVI